MMPIVGTPLHANANCERSATLFVKCTRSRNREVVAAAFAPPYPRNFSARSPGVHALACADTRKQASLMTGCFGTFLAFLWPVSTQIKRTISLEGLIGEQDHRLNQCRGTHRCGYEVNTWEQIAHREAVRPQGASQV